MKAKKAVKIIFIVLSFTLILIIASAFFTFYLITFDVKLDKNALICRNEHNDTTLLDCNGNPIEYTLNKHLTMEVGTIPQSVIDAFVAIEDKNFYSHKGIDPKRMAGAMLADIKAQSFKEGASTITQQLVKNTMLTNDKTIERKLKEIKLALDVEKNYSKDEIITMYLNNIYFGSGYYGIADASWGYYDKNVNSLTLPEICILAGVIKNPRDYSPKNSPEQAKKRMECVLNALLNDDKISRQAYEEALQYEYIAPCTQEKNKNYKNYVDEALAEACSILKISEEELINGGYKIKTYMNTDMQLYAEFLANSANFKAKNADICILMADNNIGGICVCATNMNIDPLTLKRSPASTIKPLLVYAPCLDYGIYSPESPICDEKSNFNGYSPSNYGEKYLGWCTLSDAVATSSNVVATSIMYELGSDFCLKYAENHFGLTFNEKDGLSSCLGGLTNGMSFLELLDGYQTFACNGVYKHNAFVDYIADSNNKCIYKRNINTKKSLSKETAFLLTDMLINVSKTGTGKAMPNLGYPIACKTGTNGDSIGNYDAYNISYTTANTLLVWYGTASQNSPMEAKVVGGGLPTVLAGNIYKHLKTKPIEFKRPTGIITAQIDTFARDTDHKLYLSCEYTPKNSTKTAYFNKKYAPYNYFPYCRRRLYTFD